jgi:hypothetical protein
MAIQSLDVTRITIGYLSVAATGRLTITTIGDESSWRAEFLVRAVLELGVLRSADPVVIGTNQGAVLTGQATFATIRQPAGDGHVWLTATGYGAFEVI